MVAVANSSIRMKFACILVFVSALHGVAQKDCELKLNKDSIYFLTEMNKR